MATLNYNGKDFFMDNYLYKNNDIILKKAIPKNWDCFGIIHGREGSGKTTLATQICYQLDPKFSVEKIVWTIEQFDQAIDNAEDESAILWDEAITGARANQHADSISQKIISKLTMIRKKKLKIIICFPYLYMLNKYFVSRCLFSIYVYAKGFSKRGYAFWYGSRKTEILYNFMKEKYRYDYLSAFKEARKNFYFKFTSVFCADEKEYDLLKTKYSRLGNEEKTDKYEIEVANCYDFLTKKRLLSAYAIEYDKNVNSLINFKARNKQSTH